MNNCKICVICHLYYQNMWAEIKEYLLNLQNIQDFDLYITLTNENTELNNDIVKSFKNAKIEHIDNIKGADIYPFIQIINNIDLDKYDLVYKLHTKRNLDNFSTRINGVYIGQNLWRSFLYEAILGKNKIAEVLKKFVNNPNLGMYGFSPLLVDIPNKKMPYLPQADYLYTKYKQKLNLKKTDSCKFYAGTIFVIRTEILKNIKNVFGKDDFTILTSDKSKFSKTAYDFEVLFGYLTKSLGFEYEYENNLQNFCLKFLSHKITQNIYKKFVNKYIFGRKIV